MGADVAAGCLRLAVELRATDRELPGTDYTD
jgi:hypothetical protein